jgi:hypothetical protein
MFLSKYIGVPDGLTVAINDINSTIESIPKTECEINLDQIKPENKDEEFSGDELLDDFAKIRKGLEKIRDLHTNTNDNIENTRCSVM